MAKTDNYSLRMEPNLKRRLDDVSRRRCVSKSALVGRALEAYLDKIDAQPELGLPLLRAAGAGGR